MPVSLTNSKLIYETLKECDIRLVSALPETWLVHLIRLTDEDPEMTLVRLAKEEEAVGISAGVGALVSAAPPMSIVPWVRSIWARVSVIWTTAA